jgi:hypothetical protein
MTANRERFPRPLLAVMAGFALLVLGLPLIFWFRQEYYEVCPQCARLRDVQRWLVPFTESSYYTFTQTEDTPLTLKLNEFGYLDEHEHRWLMVEGRGPGDRIIRGEGVHIASGLTTATIAPGNGGVLVCTHDPSPARCRGAQRGGSLQPGKFHGRHHLP